MLWGRWVSTSVYTNILMAVYDGALCPFQMVFGLIATPAELEFKCVVG